MKVVHPEGKDFVSCFDVASALSPVVICLWYCFGFRFWPLAFGLGFGFWHWLGLGFWHWHFGLSFWPWLLAEMNILATFTETFWRSFTSSNGRFQLGFFNEND